MSTTAKLVACVLAIAPLAAVAEDAPKLSCANDMAFSQEFLDKYPNAVAACREVVLKDGAKWARFDANVVTVKGNQVRADFLGGSRNKIATVTFSVSPDAKVQMDGKEIPATDLRSGDSLSFWVPESRAGFYAAPGAAEARKLVVISSTPASR